MNSTLWLKCIFTCFEVNKAYFQKVKNTKDSRVGDKIQMISGCTEGGTKGSECKKLKYGLNEGVFYEKRKYYQKGLSYKNK